MISRLEMPEIQALNAEDVVRAKAKYAYDKLGVPVWVDDVSLYLEAYPQFPGVYTKSVLAQIGINGLEALLKDKTHKAIMRCVLCLFTGKEYKIITGEQEGVIDCSKKIEDSEMPLSSIFVCQETMQHRAKAIEKLINEY